MLPSAGSFAAEDATLPQSEIAQATVAGASAMPSVKYFGDYELLSEIARGGMGVVYKARQVNLNRLVALKMILAGQFASDEDVKRFYTEAEAAAALEHPGIVPIFEIGQQNDQHFFSMGFVDGGSLADKIKEGPLPSKEAASYTKKVAEAIAYAHSKGVIHRDLKPANILLDRKREPKVTDFGLARRTESNSDLTRTGAVMGTPSYMPPEQAAGRTDQVGPLADVYSLGAILYCLLTGRPPFQASNPLDTLMQVMEREPVSVSTLNPATHRDLETICHKCLQKDPAKRYASAQELADDLGRWLSGEPIRARAVSSGERAWRWVKRHKAISAMCAATALCILAAMAISVGFGFKATRASQLALAAQKETEKTLASANFSLAVMNKNSGITVEAIRKMYSIPTQYRNVEWHLARREIAGRGKICYLHDGAITALAVNQDGTMIASTDAQKVIIFNLQTNKRVVQFEKPHGWDRIENLIFSPDSKTLAVFGRNVLMNETRIIASLWDIEARREKLAIKGDGDVNSIAFSPDGSQLAGSRGYWESADADSATSSGQIWIWSTKTGELLDTVATPKNYSRLYFSEDGNRIYANATDGSWHHESWRSRINENKFFNIGVFVPDRPMQIYEIELSKKAVLPLEIHGNKIFGYSDNMLSDSDNMLSFDEENTLFNSSSDTSINKITSDGSMNIKRMALGKGINKKLLSHSRSRIFAVSSDRVIKTWETISGTQIHESRAEFSKITQMRAHPDGFQIITGHQNGTVRLSDIDSIQEGFQRLNRHNSSNLCLSNDGSRYWGLSDGAICAWDKITGEKIQIIKGTRKDAFLDFFHTSRLIVSKDGSKGLLASGAGSSSDDGPQGRFELWDLQTGKLLHSFKHQGAVTNTTSISFTPDEKQAVCVDEGLIRFWDIDTGDLVREFSHKELKKDTFDAKLIHFLPKTGEMILSTVFSIWKGSPTNWERAVKFDEHGLTSKQLISSRDGRFLATSDGNSIAIYDTKSMKGLSSVREVKEYLGEMTSLAFGPDGSRLISLHIKSEKSDSRLVVWDTSNMSEVYRITTPEVSDASSVSFDHASCDFCIGTPGGIYRLNTMQGDKFAEASDFLRFSSDDRSFKLWSGQVIDCESGGFVDVSIEGWENDFKVMNGISQAKSPHGKWIAIRESTDSPIQLIPDSSFLSDSDAKKSREEAVIWHKNQLSLAINNRDIASEVFHLAWILKSDPEDAAKYDELHDAYDRLVSESKTTPLLSPAVAGALNLLRGKVEPPLTEEAAEQFVGEAWAFTGDPQQDAARRWLLANSKLEKLFRICERYRRPSFWEVLGAVYIRRSEPQKAMEALNRATSLVDAKSIPTVSHLLLALAHEQLGDLDAANRYLDQVDAYPDHLQAISETSQSLYFEACSKIRKTDKSGYAQTIPDFNLEGNLDRLLSQRWEVSEGVDEQSVFHRCRDKKRSGKYSMHLRPYQAEKNFVRRSIAVEPGTRYRFSVGCYPSAIVEETVEKETNQAKAEKQPTVSFLVQDSQASVTHTPKVMDWENVNLEFTTQPDQTSVTLEIKFDAQGATNHNGVWLDDFHIQKFELQP